MSVRPVFLAQLHDVMLMKRFTLEAQIESSQQRHSPINPPTEQRLQCSDIDILWTLVTLIIQLSHYAIFILQGGPKTDAQFYFCDNFANSAPILTILSLLQAEIYGAA